MYALLAQGPEVHQPLTKRKIGLHLIMITWVAVVTMLLCGILAFLQRQVLHGCCYLLEIAKQKCKDMFEKFPIGPKRSEPTVIT